MSKQNAESTVRSIEARIGEVQETARTAAGELSSLGLALVEARSKAQVEHRRALEIEAIEKRTELTEHLTALDNGGWNAATERKIFEGFAWLRLCRVGTGFESDHYTNG